MTGFIEMLAGHRDQAIADFRKEVEYHPDTPSAYEMLARALTETGLTDEALAVWRDVLSRNPANEKAATQAASLLLQAKRYAEASAVLEKPLAAKPENYTLRTMRIEALLRGNQTDEGVAEAEKVAKASASALVLNNLAYYLADTDTAMNLAQSLAEKAVTQTEQESAQASLDSVSKEVLARADTLAGAWDTLGWIYYKRNLFDKAEKYVNAAWQLNEDADVADHLGQIYAKEGKREAAIHMWRLALAVNGKQEDAREQLRRAGAPLVARLRVKVLAQDLPPSLVEELSKIRTIKVPPLPKQDNNAEFFLLISKAGVEDSRFITGADALKGAGTALQGAHGFTFPDDGPEKTIRRGLLSCSTYTNPSCQLVLFPPSAAAQQENGKETETNSDLTPPTLATKTEPHYSPAAIASKVEGRPQDIQVTKELGFGLDEEAKNCVSQWRFKPGTKDGKPVKVQARVQVDFRLLKNPQEGN
jgi:tetratricopeptide (TPR) repeat protein